MIGPKAYIHSSRLKKNISQIKKGIPDKNLMVVVKADAYGHGLLNVVNILTSDKDHYLLYFFNRRGFRNS